MSGKYKMIDLCAGIGGIRRGYELAGAFENVLSAEIDKNACLTYKHLYGDDPINDITTDEFKDFRVSLSVGRVKKKASMTKQEELFSLILPK